MPWSSLIRLPGSFRGRLTLWFGGLSLATLLSVGLYVGQIATKELADFGGQSLYISARSAANLLAAGLQERDKEIGMLRQTIAFTRGNLSDPELGWALTLRKRTHDEYAWIGVTDPQGRVLQATDGLLVGMEVGQRPWFQKALQGPYTGDVHEALLLAKQFPQRAANEPLRFIDFAAPILDERGRLRGVLGAHAHWSWVTQTVERVIAEGAAGRQVEVLIADQTGRILYPFTQLGEALPARQKAQAAHEVIRWDDGKTYLTSMLEVNAQTSTPLGWRIVLRQPLDVALEPVHVLRRQLLLLGLAVAVLFALVAYRLAARISRPIEQLAGAMRGIERGERTPVFPEDGQLDEIKQLGNSIRAMTTSVLNHELKLEALNTSLELQVRERTVALSKANLELERQATIDALTGLHNRRRFDTRLQENFQQLRRTGRTFCLILIDVDHFKKINDTLGHQAGDEVLRQLARLLNQSTRITDFVARYGGEEFVVLVPDTVRDEEGLTVAEKIRQSVAAAALCELGPVTVSLGLSYALPSDSSAQEVLERADQALYAAKELGRNRVVSL